MAKKYDISSVCNAIMDIVVEAQDADLAKFELSKGIMHLVDQQRQQELLSHLKSHTQTVELGGSSMNAIRTLASLGSKAIFCGSISDDPFGHQIQNRMESLGIEARLGHVDGGTGTCVILVTPDGERTMNTCLGASRHYTTNDIPLRDIANARIFHFCGYQWDTNDQKEAIIACIRAAKAAGTMVSFDAADPFVVEHHRNDFLQLIHDGLDIMFCNEAEATMLYGDPEKAAHEIAAAGATAVIKLGSKGAMIQSGSDIVRIDPVPTKVVDTTAAGDMFAAGFLFGQIKGKSLDICGRWAASIASDVISRYGARVSEDIVSKVRNEA